MYKRILYVEDEEQIAEIYATILRTQGYEVDIALDGAAGLEKTQQNKYDLILLDLMIPNISGMELLKMLRSATQPPAVEKTVDIVVLTNFEVSDSEKQEILALAQDYLIKVNTTPKTLIGILQELAIRNAK